ncbi:MAG: HAMP domain-containing sensor histidine kinase, partial [Kangiellaceae bacterium]|nr:HAMP domain-containing sensor histidine kinase [Kangiellaceae bacterium]
PLHTISLTLEYPPADEKEFLNFRQKIKDQIRRIDEHLKKLMLITTHEDLSSEKVDLVQLTSDLIAEHKLAAESIKINKVSDTDSILLDAVPSELISVFNTLINNAIESSGSTPTIEIDIKQNNADEQINWIIRDQGCGITDDVRDKLFTPHNTNKTYGSGMGLYLAYRIIKGRYQGDITYRANRPSGSEFNLVINNRKTA